MLYNKFNVLVAIAAVVSTSGSLSAQTIYSQPPLFGNGNSFPADINGGQQVDNWTPTSTLAVTSLRWWGTDGSNSGPGDFTVRFFANNSGLPGALLNQYTIGNNFTQVATGQFDFNGRDIYQFEADLTSAFAPTLGATYWLSIVNNQSVSGPPSWLWHQGSGGNGSHAFRIGTGAWNSLDGDMAFELISVPAPATLALLGVAVVRSRRRRT